MWDLNPGRDNYYHDWYICIIVLSPSSEMLAKIILKLVTTTSFHILYNSFFAGMQALEKYIVWTLLTEALNNLREKICKKGNPREANIWWDKMDGCGLDSCGSGHGPVTGSSEHGNEYSDTENVLKFLIS
jgi:hypothetical protein